MNKSEGIFESPYRMQVINALKKATGSVLDKYLPEQIGLAVELGCGTGPFYQNFAPDSLKPFLVGIDNHARSLKLFKQSSPDAKVQLGDMTDLPYEDGSVDLMIGFSSYPLLKKVGVIDEMERVLSPNGRVVAFHDSFITGLPSSENVYDKMRQVEQVHSDLKLIFSRGSWVLVDGYDPTEAVVVSPYQSVMQRIPEDMLRQIPAGKIVVATTTDTGRNKIHISDIESAAERWIDTKQELGNPRSLENVVINFGQEVAEYARFRFLVADKKG